MVAENREKKLVLQEGARDEFIRVLNSEVNNFVITPDELAYRRYDLSGFKLSGTKLEGFIKSNRSPVVKEA